MLMNFLHCTGSCNMLTIRQDDNSLVVDNNKWRADIVGMMVMIHHHQAKSVFEIH